MRIVDKIQVILRLLGSKEPKIMLRFSKKSLIEVNRWQFFVNNDLVDYFSEICVQNYSSKKEIIKIKIIVTETQAKIAYFQLLNDEIRHEDKNLISKIFNE